MQVHLQPHACLNIGTPASMLHLPACKGFLRASTLMPAHLLGRLCPGHIHQHPLLDQRHSSGCRSLPQKWSEGQGLLQALHTELVSALLQERVMTHMPCILLNDQGCMSTTPESHAAPLMADAGMTKLAHEPASNFVHPGTSVSVLEIAGTKR